MLGACVGKKINKYKRIGVRLIKVIGGYMITKQHVGVIIE